MREANRLARESHQRELRAYIGVEDEMVSDFYVNGSGRFSCKVYNRGQTPAHSVRIWSVVVATEGDPHLCKIYRGGPVEMSVMTIGPGQWVSHISESDPPLSEELVIAVASGRRTMIFAGVVSYRDAFNRQHRTIFKTILRGKGQFFSGPTDMAASLRGNRAD